MCKLCELKPVYEFTNKRKLCKNCFVNYFQKKVLYTVRKFKMIRKDDLVGYENKDDFRSVVLGEVLKILEDKGVIEVVKIDKKQLMKNLNDDEMRLVNNYNKSRAKRGKVFDKMALTTNLDSESDRIIHELIEGNMKLNKVNKKIIKPLYLFTDKEILLYAKLKNLRFKEKRIKQDKITGFVDELEEKHPEIKRAIVNSYLELMN